MDKVVEKIVSIGVPGIMLMVAIFCLERSSRRCTAMGKLKNPSGLKSKKDLGLRN